MFFPAESDVLVSCVGHACDCVGDGVLLIPCICDVIFYSSMLVSSASIWSGIVILLSFSAFSILVSIVFVLDGDSDCVIIGIMLCIMWYVYI